MVVIAIIAILAVGSVRGYSSYRTKAMINKYATERISASKARYSECMDAGGTDCGPVYIVYRNSSDGHRLYRKGINSPSSDAGTPLTDVSGWIPVITSDGKYVIYINDNDGGKFYKKDVNSPSSDP